MKKDPASFRHWFVGVIGPLTVIGVLVVGMMPAAADGRRHRDRSPGVVGSARAHQPGTNVGAPTAGSSEIDKFIAQKGMAFFDQQAKLDDFSSWIQSLPGVENSGYLQQINHPENLSVELLWHGRDPLLSRVLAEGQARGITVSVVPRSFNARQAQRAVAKAWSRSAELAQAGFSLTSVTGIKADVDAVVLNGQFTGALAAPAAGAGQAGLNQVTGRRKSLLDHEAIAIGQPVAVAAASQVVPAAATRANDVSPFKAGGYLISGSTTCSSGFSIWYRNTTWSTTARHCEPPSGSWSARDGNASYGGIKYTEDVAALSMLNSRGSGSMFSGGFDDQQGVSNKVRKIQDLNLNDYVCTSGGNSGIHCNIQVTEMMVTFDDGKGEVTTIAAYQRTSGQIAVIQGDSGGPVFSVYSNGTVGAAGMIQATDPDTTECGSVRDPGNLCSRTVYFSSIHTALNNLRGAQLVTG